MFFTRRAGERYKDRGDNAAYDFVFSDFTRDGNWNDLDLSNITGAKAQLVHLRVMAKHNATNVELNFRTKGNSNSLNIGMLRILVVDIYNAVELWVYTDVAGKIEYKCTTGTFSEIYLSVRGWFKQ